MLLITHKQNNIKEFFTEIVREIFKMSFITYLVIYLINSITSTNIILYFNINFLLYTSIVAGVISILLNKEESLNSADFGKLKSIIISISAALVTSFFIYYRIKNIGNIAFLLSSVIFLIVMILSLNILNHKDNN